MDRETFIKVHMSEALTAEKEKVLKNLSEVMDELAVAGGVVVDNQKAVTFKKITLLGETFGQRFYKLLIILDLIIGRIIMLGAQYPKAYWSRWAAFLDSLKGFGWVKFLIPGLIFAVPVSVALAFLFKAFPIPEFHSKAKAVGQTDTEGLKEKAAAYRAAVVSLDELIRKYS